MTDDWDGPAGVNWFITGLPFLVQAGSSSDPFASLAVMGNANEVLWFDRVGSSGSTYANRFGTRHTLTYDGTANIYNVVFPDGGILQLNDFSASQQGLFKRYVSPGGQAAEAVSYVSGEVEEVQRSISIGGASETESIYYTYSWYGRLSKVVLRRRTDAGAWRRVAKVEYTYWQLGSVFGSADTSLGSAGDLRTATTFRLEDEVWRPTGTTFYAYHSAATLASNPDGFVHGLRYVLGPAAVASMATDGYALSDATPTLIAGYADHEFEYDSMQRVKREKLEGSTKTITFAYTTSGNAAAPGNWRTRTVETLADGGQNVVYTNDAGQVLLNEFKMGSASWVWYTEYNAEGHRTLKAYPSVIDSYDDSQADLDVVLKSSSGLIELSEYWSTTGSGGVTGRLKAEKVRQGSSGTPVLLREYEYVTNTAGGATVHRISKETVYRNDNGTGGVETTYAYTWHSGTNRVEQRTTTLPVVPTTQNGSGVAATRVDRFDVYGNLLWTKDERGVITKHVVDPVLSVPTQRIDDVDTSQTSDEPSGWTTVSGFGLHLVSDFEYDDRGRLIQSLGPAHDADVDGQTVSVRTANWNVYLEDVSGREVRSGVGYGAGPGYTSYTLVNPVSITKVDHAGRMLEEIRAARVVAGGGTSGGGGTPSVYSAGKLTAADVFSQENYVAWTTYQRSDCCHEDGMRVYHDIPTSGMGTIGTNYGQTDFGYDAVGRRNRVVSPGGTISRTVFAARGQAIETWIGTDDSGATDSDPTGGGAIGNDMVLVSQREHDNGTDGGDGLLTQEAQYASATDTRVTSYVYDWRHRLIDTVGEEGFFERRYYDNLGRVTKTERYDSSSSGQLLARSETFYDERGRVYRAVQHEVDPATGTVGSSLSDDLWYDEARNITKRQPEGVMTQVQFTYDGLGRTLTETDPRTAVTAFAYNETGQRVLLTDAESNITTWDYDPVGRIVTETNELHDSRLFEYDPAGNLLRRTDRNERVIEFAYDDAGRMTTETWLDGTSTVNTISSVYDAEGRVQSVSDASATYHYKYDLLGRLLVVDNFSTPVLPRVILTSDYNRLDERISLTASVAGTPDFANTWQYDGLGRTTRIIQVSQTGQTIGNAVADKRVDFSYTSVGGFDAIHRYVDTTGTTLVATTQHSYDAYGRLTGTSHSQGTTALTAYSRTFDSGRRVGSTTTSYGTTSYGYDDAGQLTSADHPTGYQSDEAYSYDLTGNRTNTGYVIGANNQLLADGLYSPHTYEYDAEGNRTKRVETSTGDYVEYGWDHRNRLTSVAFKTSANVLTKKVAYSYDPQDRRIVKRLDVNGDGIYETDEFFAFDQFVKDGLDDCLFVFESSSVANRYLHGPSADQPLADETLAELRWYLADPLGSIPHEVRWNSGSGTTTLVGGADRFDSFGQPRGLTHPRRYGFTAREWDQHTELYWYRARWYDAFVGQFASEDPLGYRARDSHFYRIVGNSPTNHTDPSGLLFGWGYGTYCGWSKRGPGAPIDALDAACQKHDQCQATWWTCNPYHITKCSNDLCQGAIDASDFGCAQSYPPGSDKQICACQVAAAQVGALFCNLGSGPFNRDPRSSSACERYFMSKKRPDLKKAIDDALEG